MHSTELRREHILGMLLGVAAGEAMGGARVGLSRRQAIRLFGPAGSQYRPRKAHRFAGFNTAQVLLAAQAVLSSGTDLDDFDSGFLRRLKWYSLSCPPNQTKSSRSVGLRCWFRLTLKNPPRPSASKTADCLTRTILLVMALHNTNLRSRSWVEHSTRLTHSHPHVLEGCKIIANLTKLAIQHRDALDPSKAMADLISSDATAEFKQPLQQMAVWLEQQRGSAYVARQFSWDNRVPSEIVPTVIMATYCFLRHSGDFHRAVCSAAGLGGNCGILAATVGGLCGARLGRRRIPDPWIRHLEDFGQSPTWLAELAERLTQWPHGVDDLTAPTPLPWSALGTLTNHIGIQIRRPIRHVMRQPWLMGIGLPKRCRPAR